MFAHAYFPSAHFAPVYYPPVVAVAPVAPAGNKGRRLVRWMMPLPSLNAPVGEWIRQREDDEELFILQ